MTARPIVLLASCIFLFVQAPPAWGLTIKLGSLAPSGSPWDKGLCRLGAEWQKISNGTVEPKIYPGGIVGDESDMTRKMRIGQLNAAGLSGRGAVPHLPRNRDGPAPPVYPQQRRAQLRS